MVGGPPIAQPYYPYQYPAPVQPQAYVQQPRPQPARPAAPVVRGQMPEEHPAAKPVPRKAAVPEMPPPEALGVAVPPPPPDWTELRVRLDRLGATRFSLEKQADGYRFTCEVRTTAGPRTIEGRAATEAEAVQRTLAQVSR
jgi:hypothetical protein